MPFELAFTILTFITLIIAAYGADRYNTPLNPLTFTATINVGLFTLVSGAIAYTRLATTSYTNSDMANVILISLISLLGTLVPYLFCGSWPSQLFSKVLNILKLSSEQVATKFNLIKFILLLTGSLCAFMALALLGGGGTLWLTDTRNAYIQYRSGAGLFYAMTQWLLMFALLYYIWARPWRWFNLLLTLSFFAVIAYFTGSKGNILLIIVVGIIYYHFKIRPIPIKGFVLLTSLLLFAFIGLLIVQGSAKNPLGAISYFNDYFDTTARFISRFEEFGFQYGCASLSSLWFYVPRSLYPDKPYEYGITLIHQVLYPGMAATGNTPGVLGWALAYLDYGVVGVFLSGAWAGLLQRSAYEHFFRHKQSFFAFLLMMQLAMWPPLPFATLEMTVVLCTDLRVDS